MKTGKVALLGANGQLGQTLLQAWVTGETTRNLALQCLDLPEFDLTNKGQVQQILDQEKFDFIINAAAYTQVDQAEKDSDAAFAINQTGVENPGSLGCREQCTPGAHINRLCFRW